MWFVEELKTIHKSSMSLVWVAVCPGSVLVGGFVEGVHCRWFSKNNRRRNMSFRDRILKEHFWKRFVNNSRDVLGKRFLYKKGFGKHFLLSGFPRNVMFRQSSGKHVFE